jgi:hypothetical protein
MLLNKMYLFISMTILSLIVTILYYYGIIRYFTLHVKDTNSYLENYKNLDKAFKEKKIIISLSVRPEKIDKIKPMINSILDQTVGANQIVLNLPNNQDYNIPKEYENIFTIFRCGKDYGECNKFIPTLLREENSDTIIILLDEQYVFGQDYIENMVEEYKKDKCGIISKGGILIIPEFFDMDIYDRDKKCLDNGWIKDCVKVKTKNITSNDTYKIFNF